MKIRRFTAAIAASLLCMGLCACTVNEPTLLPTTANDPVQSGNAEKTPIITHTAEEETVFPTNTESVEPSLSAKPTEVPTPGSTPDPLYDEAYGPFTFGEATYKINIGEDSVIFFNTDKTVFYEFEDMKIPEGEKDLFLLTVSFMDLNFDVVPDFSYEKPDCTRVCYLWVKGDTAAFEYNAPLSIIYDLTRCYETRELYGKTEKDSEDYYTFKISEDGVITGSEELMHVYLWNIQSVSDAITGGTVEPVAVEDVVIRSVKCKAYTIGGFITVAHDEWGNFFIKDMPHRGFCRLVLNPSGRWSKSEKVMADSVLG